MLMTLLCRVAVKPDSIEITISRRRLAALLAGQSIEQCRIRGWTVTPMMS
jgi:hypothetical protein